MLQQIWNNQEKVGHFTGKACNFHIQQPYTKLTADINIHLNRPTHPDRLQIAKITREEASMRESRLSRWLHGAPRDNGPQGHPRSLRPLTSPVEESEMRTTHKRNEIPMAASRNMGGHYGPAQFKDMENCRGH